MSARLPHEFPDALAMDEVNIDIAIKDFIKAATDATTANDAIAIWRRAQAIEAQVVRMVDYVSRQATYLSETADLKQLVETL